VPVTAEDLPMGSLSIWHWIIVLVVVMVLFGGRGKISSLMGDFAQGIKAFKKGMSEDDKTADSTPEPAKTIDHQAASATPKTEAERAGTVRS
jgi:sec-independent protein translocase protein TatA